MAGAPASRRNLDRVQGRRDPVERGVKIIMTAIGALLPGERYRDHPMSLGQLVGKVGLRRNPATTLQQDARLACALLPRLNVRAIDQYLFLSALHDLSPQALAYAERAERWT